MLHENLTQKISETNETYYIHSLEQTNRIIVDKMFFTCLVLVTFSCDVVSLL